MDTVIDIVTLIRENYDANISIILVGDSGFLANAAFNYFEDVLKIDYVVSGKMYNAIKGYIREVPAGEYKEFNGRATWNYYEFGNRLETWKKFRRIIFTALTTATVQTFGALLLWHCLVHAIFSEGVFMKDGTFVNMPDVDLAKCVARCQKKVFALLVRKKRSSGMLSRRCTSGRTRDSTYTIRCAMLKSRKMI